MTQKSNARIASSFVVRARRHDPFHMHERGGFDFDQRFTSVAAASGKPSKRGGPPKACGTAASSVADGSLGETAAGPFEPTFRVHERARPERAAPAADDHSPSRDRCTPSSSLISAITIARVPLRSNTVPLARTYFPTKGISFFR